MAESNIIRDAVNRVMSGIITITGTFNPPAACINQTHLTTTALLPASKLVSRFPAYVEQVTGTVVATRTSVIHVAKFTGIVKSIEAVTTTLPTGDYTITFDLHKSTAGGAFATVLSSTFDIDAADTVRVAVAGTIDAAKDDYVDGDVFLLSVTAAGASGAQGQGLNVTVFFQENPTA